MKAKLARSLPDLGTVDAHNYTREQQIFAQNGKTSTRVSRRLQHKTDCRPLTGSHNGVQGAQQAPIACADPDMAQALKNIAERQLRITYGGAKA